MTSPFSPFERDAQRIRLKGLQSPENREIRGEPRTFPGSDSPLFAFDETVKSPPRVDPESRRRAIDESGRAIETETGAGDAVAKLMSLELKTGELSLSCQPVRSLLARATALGDFTFAQRLLKIATLSMPSASLGEISAHLQQLTREALRDDADVQANTARKLLESLGMSLAEEVKAEAADTTARRLMTQNDRTAYELMRRFGIEPALVMRRLLDPLPGSSAARLSTFERFRINFGISLGSAERSQAQTLLLSIFQGNDPEEHRLAGHLILQNTAPFGIEWRTHPLPIRMRAAVAGLRSAAHGGAESAYSAIGECLGLDKNSVRSAREAALTSALDDGALAEVEWTIQVFPADPLSQVSTKGRAVALERIAHLLRHGGHREAERMGKLIAVTVAESRSPAMVEALAVLAEDLLRRQCGCAECKQRWSALQCLTHGKYSNPLSVVLAQIESCLDRGNVDTALHFASKRTAGELRPLQTKALGLLDVVIHKRRWDHLELLVERFHAGPEDLAALRQQITSGVCDALSRDDTGCIPLLPKLGVSEAPEIQNAAQGLFHRALEAKNLERLRQLGAALPAALGRYRARVIQAIHGAYEQGTASDETVRALIQCYGIPARAFRGVHARESGYRALEVALGAGQLGKALDICTRFEIRPNTSHTQLLARTLPDGLANASPAQAVGLLKLLPPTVVDASLREQLRPLGVRLILLAASDFDLERVTELRRAFSVGPADYDRRFDDVMVQSTKQQRCQGARALAHALDFPLDRPIPNIDATGPFYRSIIQGIGLRSFGELFAFVTSNQEYCNWLAGQGVTCQITPSVYSLLRKPKESSSPGVPLSLLDADLLVRNGIDVARAASSGDHSKILANLLAVHAPRCSFPWLASLEEALGAEYLLEYLFRPNSLRHSPPHRQLEALDLLRLKSGCSWKELRHQILDPVRRDGASYDQRTPQEELAEILYACSFSFPVVEESAEPFEAIAPLTKLLSHFSSGQSPFASWESLKRWAKLERALQEETFLEELLVLQKTDSALYGYACDLYFTTTSRVSPDAVEEFISDFQSFLDRPDQHMHPRLFDSIKASHLTDGTVPYLPRFPEELRHALVSGWLDARQALHPLKVTYQVPTRGPRFASLQAAFVGAVGERNSGVQGLAQRGGAVFKRVRDCLATRNITVGAFLTESVQFDASTHRELLDIIYDPTDGIREEWMTVTAEIHKSSSPEAVRVGDDTACCMPFGQGKSTLYHLDPNCALFTVTMTRGTGSPRTVAQSVLTRDLPSQHSLNTLLQAMKATHTNLTEVLPTPPRMQGPFRVTCDNLQMAPNARADRGAEELVLAIYADFFLAYRQAYGVPDQLDLESVDIGQNASSGIDHLPTARNTSIPLTFPIGYCDRNEEQVRRLAIPAQPLFLRREIVPSDVGSEPPPPSGAGVSPLTLAQMLPFAYLRGHAYRSESAARASAQSARIELLGMTLANGSLNLRNLSRYRQDSAGEMKAALFAYHTEHGNAHPSVFIRDLIGSSPSLATLHLLNPLIDDLLRLMGSGDEQDILFRASHAFADRPWRVLSTYLTRRHPIQLSLQKTSDYERPDSGQTTDQVLYRATLRRRATGGATT